MSKASNLFSPAIYSKGQSGLSNGSGAQNLRPTDVALTHVALVFDFLLGGPIGPEARSAPHKCHVDESHVRLSAMLGSFSYYLTKPRRLVHSSFAKVEYYGLPPEGPGCTSGANSLVEEFGGAFGVQGLADHWEKTILGHVS